MNPSSSSRHHPTHHHHRRHHQLLFNSSSHLNSSASLPNSPPVRKRLPFPLFSGSTSSHSNQRRLSRIVKTKAALTSEFFPDHSFPHFSLFELSVLERRSHSQPSILSGTIPRIQIQDFGGSEESAFHSEPPPTPTFLRCEGLFKEHNSLVPTGSLPSKINQLVSDDDDDNDDESECFETLEDEDDDEEINEEDFMGRGRREIRLSRQRISSFSNSGLKRGNKLKRRKAWYGRERKDFSGRSKSLTSIDSVSLSSQSNKCCIDKMLTVPSGWSLRKNLSNEDCHQRRKKLSTTGKVSSSEFFTVSFECLEPEAGPEEYLPITRGTSLREALAPVCDRRGVDIENINAYLGVSRTSLPLLTSETAWLGGKHIKIKAKDDSKSPVRNSSSINITCSSTVSNNRKNSANQRKSNKMFYSCSMSSDEYASSNSSLMTLHANSQSFGGSSNQQASLSSVSQRALMDDRNKNKQRWNGLWTPSSLKETKMDMLIFQLDLYSKFGIPRLQHLIPFEAVDEVEEALYTLEESWTSFVTMTDSMSDKVFAQQEAIWEMVTTEVAYIHTLKVIQDLFLNCLLNLQQNQILKEIDKTHLFSNIPEIYAANRHFMYKHIIPMLNASRKSGESLNPTYMLEGFIKFDELFNSYSRYCLDQKNCQEYCRVQDRNSEIFKAYLAWCETQRDCNRLRLIDILVKPMQRLTKYSLLLKAILKKTEDENQRKALNDMEKKVSCFVSHVNSQLRNREENEKLRLIIGRIDAYEPVETKDEELERLLQNHCKLDLMSPMPGCSELQIRQLLYEGDLKLKEGSSSKTDVHVFLFSDMLLLTKNLTKKQGGGGEGRLKVIRQPFVIDRLLNYELTKDSLGLALIYLNEYSIVVSAFTLHAHESRVIQGWQRVLKRAKEEFEEVKYSHYNIMSRCTRDELSLTHNYESCASSSNLESTGEYTSQNSEDSLLIKSYSSFGNEENSLYKSVSSVSQHVSPIHSPHKNQCSYPSSPRSERRHILIRSSNSHLTVPTSNSSHPPEEGFRENFSKRSPTLSSEPKRGSSYPPSYQKSLKSKENAFLESESLRYNLSLDSEAQNLSQFYSEPLEENKVVTTKKNIGRTIDNRRYHTAGAIEDLKKNDVRDTSIHKRLSWNYGQGNTDKLETSSNDLDGKIKINNKCLSTDSIQSSSGVSSTGSLQLSLGLDSNSSWLQNNEEHSTNESLANLTVCVNSCPVAVSSETKRLNSSSFREPPPIPPRTNITHVSTTYITQDEVTICDGSLSSETTSKSSHSEKELPVKHKESL